MANVVIFDLNATPQKVLKYLISVNTPDFDGREDVVVNPNLSTVSALPLRYWKHVTGTIVEMTQGEKDAVDAALAANLLLVAKNEAKSVIDGLGGYNARALAKLMIDEINVLRQWLAAFKVEVAAASSLADLKARVATLPATGDRTLAQAKTAYKNLIDGSSLDE